MTTSHAKSENFPDGFADPATTYENGEPIKSSQTPLQLLRAGSFHLEGLLQQHMIEDATVGWVPTCQEHSLSGFWMDGWGSFRLRETDRIAPYYTPFIDREGAPVGGEYHAHWLDAALRFANTAQIPEYQSLMADAMDRILEVAEQNGYIAVDSLENQLTGNTIDGRYAFYAWGEMLRSLLLYYDYTNDEQALQLTRSSVDRFLKNYSQPDKLVQKWSVIVCSPLAHLGIITGEEKYITAAEEIFSAWQNSPKASGNWSSLLSHPDDVSGHAAGWGIYLLAASDLYEATGKQKYLDAVIHASGIITEKHQLPHGSVSHDKGETVCGAGPNEKSELCSHWWYAWLWSTLTRLTGDANFADDAEKILYNALPASRAKDARAVRYYMSPNQLVTPFGTRPFPKGLYQERQYIECCMSNAPRVVPLIADRMIMRKGEGLAFLYYAPYQANIALQNGQTLGISCETEYPFLSQISFSLDLQDATSVPLSFRIPQWTDGRFELWLNGNELTGSYDPDSGWLTTEQEWQNGDRIELKLPMDVRVTTSREQGAFVERGPLLFSLSIPGTRTESNTHGYFSYKEQMEESASWNYALALDKNDLSSGIRVVKRETAPGSHAWEEPPVELVLSASILDDWKFDPENPDMWKGLPLESPTLPSSPVEPEKNTLEELRLVPIGYTSLRMTYFPFFYQ